MERENRVQLVGSGCMYVCIKIKCINLAYSEEEIERFV